MVNEINIEEKDVMVEFMQPHGPQKNFKWPRKQDRCLVPIQSVLFTVSPPVTTTVRIYQRLTRSMMIS